MVFRTAPISDIKSYLVYLFFQKYFFRPHIWPIKILEKPYADVL